MKKDIVNQSERSFNFLEQRYFNLIEDLIDKNSSSVFLVIQKARQDILFKDDAYIYFFLNLISKSKPEDYVSVFLKYEVFGLDPVFVNETLNNLLFLLNDVEFMNVFQKNTKQKMEDLNNKDIAISPKLYRKMNFFVSAVNLNENELREVLQNNDIKFHANHLDSVLDKKTKEDAEIFKI